MIPPGVDEFGYTRSQRIEMADNELADARYMARVWKRCNGSPIEHVFADIQEARVYQSTLLSAANLYAADGLGLLARRVRRLAKEVDVPRAWATFDRLNAKETL